jgi:hypothetical protein
VTLQGADPSPIVVDNCRENCSPTGNVPKCAAEPVFCPPSWRCEAVAIRDPVRRRPLADRAAGGSSGASEEPVGTERPAGDAGCRNEGGSDWQNPVANPVGLTGDEAAGGA